MHKYKFTKKKINMNTHAHTQTPEYKQEMGTQIQTYTHTSRETLKYMQNIIARIYPEHESEEKKKYTNYKHKYTTSTQIYT